MVDEPNQVASVTSAHAEEPGVVLVPESQAIQALDVTAEAPPREYVLEPHMLVVPELWPATHQKPAGHTTCRVPPE